jgi:Uma2 family endonuclease
MSTVSDPLTDRLIAELYRVEGKAEIVEGQVVLLAPAGDLPGSAAGAILASLRATEKLPDGLAISGNVGFLAKLPHRKSFCPDAGFYAGPRAGMKFLPQPPEFAVEVRNEEDYGIAAEERMADKRADYFAAGTKVVWDVDLQSDDVVRVYRDTSPDQPAIYRRGEMAEAEPAVPGWTMPVDELFE